MRDLILTNVHILDPGALDMPGEVTLSGNKISKVSFSGMRKNKSVAAAIINCKGLLLVPGLIDMHVHLRDPGQTHKESISTGAMAAVKGGFTGICCMANTSPVNDNPKVTAYILKEAQRAGLCNVYPISAVTEGLLGNDPVDFAAQKAAGARGFSDDGVPVLQSDIMLNALEAAAKTGLPLISHCEDYGLTRGKVIMRAGEIAVCMGLEGIPAVTETIMVTRDLFLAEIAGCPIHIAHVSTAQSVEAIRQAKKRGVKVTCETAPHYFTLTTEAIEQHGTNAKMNPPLGSDADREAVKAALADGTIDVIATDHAPHTPAEKNQPFAFAPNGIIGLETALPLSLALAKNNIVPFNKIIAALSRNPAKILGLECGIYEGAPANLTLIDPNFKHMLNITELASKSRNTPFVNMQLTGLAAMTIVNGEVVWQNKSALTWPSNIQ